MQVKDKENIFYFFLVRQGLILLYIFSSMMENQGINSSL